MDFLQAILVNLVCAIDSIKLEMLAFGEERAKEIRLFWRISNRVFVQSIPVSNWALRTHLSYILEKNDLAGMPIFEDFFESCEINSEQKSIMLNTLDMAFGCDVDVFGCNDHNLLHEVKYNAGDRSKICELDWVPIAHSSGA